MAELVQARAPMEARVLALALVALGVVTAVAVGLAAGYPAPDILVPAGLLVGLWIIGLAVWRPFAAYLVLAVSSFLLMVVVTSVGPAVNAFDFLLPPVVAVSLIGSARRQALTADAAARGPHHAAIETATRAIKNAGLVYYCVMGLSLGLLVIHGRPDLAGNSALKLLRGVQGLMLFALGIWWLRSDRRLHLVTQAMLAGGILFTIVNTIGIVFAGVPRAGLVFYLNNPEWPIDSPNEAAPAMLILVVLLLVRQSLRPQMRNYVMIAVAVIMLVLSASRSGLLAFGVFTLMTIWRAGWKRVVTVAILVGAALPLVPVLYWERLLRTVTMAKGSFEAYTSIIRIYSWHAAWRMFLDHPLTGVGFLGFIGWSRQYNDLGLVLIVVESYFLEMAVSLGIIGLTALAVLLVRMYRVGQVIRRETPPGTLGHAMARYHTPLLTALLAANLTGDNFVGMVGIAQLSLWMAVLIRAGRLAVDSAPAVARGAAGNAGA
jgi:O-antigen ligase